MIYNELGRTGLKVSAIGIGAGGPSRLGLANGRSSASAIRLIRFGLDRGINVLDTAAIYGTEDIVGRYGTGDIRFVRDDRGTLCANARTAP